MRKIDGRTKEARQKTLRALRKADRAARAGDASSAETSGRDERDVGDGGGGSNPGESGQDALPLRSRGGPPVVEGRIERSELESIPKGEKRAEESGLEAAKAALGIEERGAREPGENPETVEGVLQLCEMIFGLSITLFAGKAKASSVDQALRLSDGEKGLLRIFAPGAAPQVEAAANASREIAFFGLVAVLGVLSFSRVRALRAEAKENASQAIASPAPAPVSAPGTISPEILEHKRLWGSASDAVKPGTKIVDIGLPARWKPKQERA